eukprot:8975-Heterococcus_DN1.PRE.4
MTKAYITQDVTQSASVAKHTRGAASISTICEGCAFHCATHAFTNKTKRPKLSRSDFANRSPWIFSMILALPLVEQGCRKQEAEHKLRVPVNLNVSHGVIHEVVLQRIVSYVGTGHYLLLGLVSKEWQAACAAVGGTPLLQCAHDGHTVALDYCYYYTTKYSAIFASTACLRYAHGIGVFPRQTNWLIDLMARTSLSNEKENVIDRDWQLKQVAGKIASIPMLILARELGMSITSDVLLGAAQSGDIAKK